jgi:dTDP-4-dehydrorhamnose reductase
MKRLRLLLIGKNGQLGWEFQRTLACLGDLIVLDWPEVDLAKPAAVREAVRREKPDVIVNAAAYTAVDKAESEPEKARAINAEAPRVLAEEARALGAAFVHFSTDYVFDGQKEGAYKEDDEPKPLNVYGWSKLEGEREVLGQGGAAWIFRTSWMYSDRRDSFVNKVMEWSRVQKQMRVVGDQWGCPTRSRMLAEIMTLALAMGKEDPVGWVGETAGLYHLAGDGGTSRFQFAQEILRLDPQREQQVVSELTQAQTSDFPTPAQRPLNAVLDCSKFKLEFGISLPNWQKALELMLRR